MSQPERKQFEKLSYVVQQPDGAVPGEKYPLVIYLHGAGGRGRNLSLMENHPFFQQGTPGMRGMIAAVPQCYSNSWFDIFEQLQEFVRFAAGWSQVDPERVYLMGASMGGYASWQLAMTCPELFAAVVPICGGGMYWNAERLKNVAVWAFHGEEDTAVYPEESRKMVDAVNRLGGQAKLTLYPGVGHNAWSPTFLSDETWAWLSSQKRKAEKAPEIQFAKDDVKNFG